MQALALEDFEKIQPEQSKEKHKSFTVLTSFSFYFMCNDWMGFGFGRLVKIQHPAVILGSSIFILLRSSLSSVSEENVKFY